MRLALWISTTFLASALSAGAAPLETWVQEGDPVPGTDQHLLIAGEPALGHDDLAFFGLTDQGYGIFLADRDGVQERVGDRWWSGAGGLSYDGDWLVFTAFGDSPGCLDCLALHRHAGGVLTEIVAAGDPVPEHPGRVISGFGAPSTDGGEIVVLVTAVFDDIPNPFPVAAILRYTEAAGVELALPVGAPVPGAVPQTFSHFSEARVTDGTIAFRGHFGDGMGIFLERGGEVTRAAVLGDAVPGGLPGEVFERFPEDARLTTSDGAVAFLAEGSLGSAGIYRTAGGTLEAAVDTRTPVPGGTEGETFTYFGQAALVERDLVFEGGREGRPFFDLYLLRDGEVSRIAEAGEAGGFFLSPDGTRGGRVAFLDHGREPPRLRVASLDGAVPPPDGDVYTTELYPDFRFTVKISAGGEAVPTRADAECLADALCVSGALPGRAEVALRILGPRPNGRLWPVIGRLSPSRVEVWIEQLSTGLLRYYPLDALPPGSEELPGLVDRQGFPATE